MTTTSSRSRPSTDCIAPWRISEPHREQPWPFFLDRAGAISFVGSRPVSQIIVEPNGRARVWTEGRWRTLDEHPIDAVANYIEANAATPRKAPAELASVAGLPRTVGYLAYELGAFIEEVTSHADPAGCPLALLSTYDSVEASIPGHDGPVTLEFERRGRRRELRSPPPLSCSPLMVPAPAAPVAMSSYRHAFARIHRAIREGDIYQANLSRRLDLAFADDPATTYARLRRLQPVPHGAYLDFGPRQLLSNSPECFLRVHGDEIETRPIKGTRARNADAPGDRAAIAELGADPKERAEHVMIVDLERNDLGRVCRVGSVEVSRYAAVKSYATVHHLVSHVRGSLAGGVSLAEILRATFPGGSITGAPKIRAMEIIAEVEAQGRGVYTGAIGSFNGARSLELSIAIRTAIVGAGRVHYSVGGGIVADSRWQSEYEETNAKARAFIESLGRAPSDTRAVI